MHLPLLLLLCYDRRLMFCQSPPNRPCLLRTQIQWRIFLALVEDSKLGTLLSINVCKNAGDGFPEVVATGKVNLGFRRSKYQGSLFQLEDRNTGTRTGSLHFGQFRSGATRYLLGA